MEQGQYIREMKNTHKSICDYCDRSNCPNSPEKWDGGNCCESDRFTDGKSNNPCHYCLVHPCEDNGCDGYDKFIGKDEIQRGLGLRTTNGFMAPDCQSVAQTAPDGSAS